MFWGFSIAADDRCQCVFPCFRVTIFCQALLGVLYRAYATAGSPDAAGGAAGDAPGHASGHAAGTGGVSLGGLTRLLADFSVPGNLSRARVYRLFRATARHAAAEARRAARAAAGESDADEDADDDDDEELELDVRNALLGYPSFVELVGRVALTAYARTHEVRYPGHRRLYDRGLH